MIPKASSVGLFVSFFTITMAFDTTTVTSTTSAALTTPTTAAAAKTTTITTTDAQLSVTSTKSSLTSPSIKARKDTFVSDLNQDRSMDKNKTQDVSHDSTGLSKQPRTKDLNAEKDVSIPITAKNKLKLKIIDKKAKISNKSLETKHKDRTKHGTTESETKHSTNKPSLSEIIDKERNRPKMQRKTEHQIDKAIDIEKHDIREFTNPDTGPNQKVSSRKTKDLKTYKNFKLKKIQEDLLKEKKRAKNRPSQRRYIDHQHQQRRKFRTKYRHKIGSSRLFSTGTLNSKSSLSGKKTSSKKSKKAGPPIDYCSKCKENAKLDEERVQEIRRRMFVDMIAEKLRVSPKDLIGRGRHRHPVKYPRELIEETLQDNAMEYGTDEFYAKDEKVVIIGHDLGKSCISKRTSGCFRFDLAGKIQGEVSSASLYVYKTPDRKDHAHIPQTYFLYGLEKLRSGRVLARNKQIQRYDSHVREGWVVINVTRAVSAWVNQRKDSEMIAIRCATCATRNHKSLFGFKQGYRPLLIVEYDANHHRARRSFDDSCNPEVECCKRRLEVNFMDLQLTNVVAPPHISVGYCFGSCTWMLGTTMNHTYFKQRVRLVSETASRSLRDQMQSCCVPTSFKSTHIFLQTQNHFARKTLLPNAIVDTCGCV